MLRRFSLRTLLSSGLLLLFIIMALGIIPLPFLTQLENITYDWRVRLTTPNTVDPRVVIVDIDEKSLAQLGRWPWGRDVMARLTETLFTHYQVATLGFDVVFAEPDSSSGLGVMEALAQGRLRDDPAFLDALEQLRPSLQRDRLFATSLANRPVIMGLYFKQFIEQGSATSGALPAPLIALADLGTVLAVPQATGYGANLKVLQDNAAGGGFFDNPLLDEDGVFRRVPLMQEYNGGLYPSLALAVVRRYLGGAPLSFGIAPDNVVNGVNFGLEWIGVGQNRIPVDEHGGVLVPYRGKQGSFPYLPVVDVINRQVPRDVLRNAIVLLGTTAPGLLDLRTVPVQKAYPGVEVHANVISGILDGSTKHHPGYVKGLEFLFLLVIGVAMTVLMPRLGPSLSAGLGVGIMVLVVGINLYQWQSANLVLPLASPLLLTLSLFLLHMSYGFFVESRNKHRISRMFGQYVPGELVDEMNRSGQEFSIGGEIREMTVLFSDVRGFTTISEGLKPEELTQLMNAFLTPMTRVIHQHRGTIDKYMGDAIMAFWGAPLDDPEHPRHALEAGMEMIRAMAELREAFAARGWPPLKIGVGINTGMMNVGNMGSEFRMAYTVLGDAVNLGSRLEGLTKQYGVSLIASEYTVAKVPEMVFRDLDLVRVKGKDEPVGIFEPVGLREGLDQQTLTRVEAYHQALAFYRDGNFKEAARRFLALQKLEPERAIHTVYIDRLRVFLKTPPGPGWDGVFTHTSK